MEQREKTSRLRRRGRSVWWRRLMIGTALAAYGASLGPIVSYAARWSWIFDLASHFRVQYVLWFTSLTVAFAGCRLWGLAAGSGLLLIGHAASLWPFYAPRTYRQHNGIRLRVMSTNVHSRNDHFDSVLDFVRKESPDVALFLEVNDAWGSALTALTDGWPFSHTDARRDTRGIAIFSRLPFQDVQIQLLTQGVPTIVARISLKGIPLTFIGAHPHSPVSRAMSAIRDLQCLELAQLVTDAQGESILIGDRNMTSWSPAFTDLISRSGLRDSRRGLGVQPSWPSFLPAVLRIPIDHCLVSPAVQIANRRIGPDIGSDHLPVIVDLEVNQSREGSSDGGDLPSRPEGVS